ncbi:12411_t:CDS:2, partial [Funneliformis caledonium]
MPLQSCPISSSPSPSSPIAIIHRQNDGEYWFCLEGRYTRFIIPTSDDVLSTCRVASRKPPTIFIIFRNPVQRCMRILNKYERHQVSRISSNLWKHVKSEHPELRDIFQSLYLSTKEKWKKRTLVFEFFTPVIGTTPENKKSSTDMTLTSSEETKITEELFEGLAHIPG